jgi:hypothetical protein
MTGDPSRRATTSPTFDQELLAWLGDEPPSVRVADAERIREIAAEFAPDFDRLAARGPQSRCSAPRARPPNTPTMA